MTIQLTIDVDAALRKLIGAFDPNDPKLKSKIASAMNFAARDLRKKSQSILKQDMGFPTRRVNNGNFSQQRASRSSMETTLFVTGAPIPMVEFDGVREGAEIHVKYTDRTISAGSGNYFQRTSWQKVQQTYNQRRAAGLPVTLNNGKPLDFLDKKNADRVAIMETSRDSKKDPGARSAFKGMQGVQRAETDEVFGISAATGIMMPKFGKQFDIYDNGALQDRFESKLAELLK